MGDLVSINPNNPKNVLTLCKLLINFVATFTAGWGHHAAGGAAAQRGRGDQGCGGEHGLALGHQQHQEDAEDHLQQHLQHLQQQAQECQVSHVSIR